MNSSCGRIPSLLPWLRIHRPIYTQYRFFSILDKCNPTRISCLSLAVALCSPIAASAGSCYFPQMMSCSIVVQARSLIIRLHMQYHNIQRKWTGLVLSHACIRVPLAYLSHHHHPQHWCSDKMVLEAFKLSRQSVVLKFLSEELQNVDFHHIHDAKYINY